MGKTPFGNAKLDDMFEKGEQKISAAKSIAVIEVTEWGIESKAGIFECSVLILVNSFIFYF